MLILATASGPETRKGRVVATRPLTKSVSNDTAADSTTALRLQRLRLLGIIGARAEMIAPLAWGEAA